MQRVILDAPVPSSLRGAVLALGNFDGFHLGHQAVVGRAVARAHHEGRPALVVTFDPHPAALLRPDSPPFRLTSLDQRERLFAAAGADAMLVIPFTPALAEMRAEQFVRDRLIGQAWAAAVVTGQDFTFGRDREGNADKLREVGAGEALAVEAIGPVELGGAKVSSSRIRQALVDGDVATATRLLTRPFAIQGVVEHGDARGRELGFPTANLRLGDYQRPRYGIYAVRVRLPDGRELGGVASLGVRPSFSPPVELLEPFLFDFSGDLYGQTIEVALHAWLRPEEKFDSIEALKGRMAEDCQAARRALAVPA